MQVVDIVVLVLLLVALIIGFQRGLLASLGTLVGLGIGAVGAYWLMPFVTAALPWPMWRALAVIAATLLLLAGCAALGSAAGNALRRGVDRTPLRGIDRLLGGGLTLVAAALAVSLVGSGLAATGTPIVSTAIASSRVLTVIESIVPRPLQAGLAELRGAVLGDAIPTLGGLLLPGTAEVQPPVQLDDPELAEAAASVARITGVAYACGLSSSGSGFVIAADRVVTNAHVVAGVDRPVVELPGREARDGRVVYFDPIGDIAVIAVDDLDAEPLDVVPVLPAGSSAAVQGYPHGGPFESMSAAVLAVGTVPVPDIYDESSNLREIYTLEANVRPGNSGGPLLTADGDVAGLVFARGGEQESRGYASTSTELAPIVTGAAGWQSPVSSGTCTR
ncbi:MAG: MarP family serine protease [Microbacterium sp.]|uniref:MarP family serine protease n=1 Tax=Microbacterium sp. TaxID=51671 RepID=UPI002716D13C|nr:MarP family serine protease [Microbacterium sp.]MDO8382087.1 MarP family serine protease [Microbacterium sp.]